MIHIYNTIIGIFKSKSLGITSILSLILTQGQPVAESLGLTVQDTATAVGAIYATLRIWHEYFKQRKKPLQAK